MLNETKPVAAMFVGGMEGFRDEYGPPSEQPQRPLAHPIGRPGGEAAQLVLQIDSPLRDTLATNDV